jgi:hypothetical protein
MRSKKPTAYGYGNNKKDFIEANMTSKGARILTSHELATLRRDMAESSAKMRTELARRRNDCPTKQDL